MRLTGREGPGILHVRDEQTRRWPAPAETPAAAMPDRCRATPDSRKWRAFERACVFRYVLANCSRPFPSRRCLRGNPSVGKQDIGLNQRLSDRGRRADRVQAESHVRHEADHIIEQWLPFVKFRKA